ncbi:MAG: HAMP domain-containing sensor histidine kinase [Cyclobacteriaceae bacterium]
MQTAIHNFFNRWLNYQTDSSADQHLFFIRRREILLSRILVLSAIAETLITLKDILVMRVSVSVYIDLAILLIMLISFRMVQTGYQKAAKSFFLSLMNGFTVFYASTLPSDRGIFLYFFPLITMAFAFFDETEVSFRAFFILLPITLLILLVITDFNLLGNVKLATSKHGKYNLAINAVITSMLVTFFIEFMIRANRKSESLLRELADNLQRKKEDIEKINKELDRFVYSASHDLRAPLSSIQGITKLALMSPDHSQDEKYFTMINTSTRKLDEFINEIIDYSRNARTELKPELIDLAEMADETVVNLKFLDHADRIQFEMDNKAGTVMMDKSRMKIVFNNLISNAIKYQDLRAERSWVKIETSLMDGNCKITFRDNGIGIARESQGKIFEMFFRATEKSTGSGLGLYIVKEIVQRLGGTITMTSELGEGTSFEIVIPMT